MTKLEKIAEKYAKKECEDVRTSKNYTPSEIYHLCKTIFMDGYNAKEKECKREVDKASNHMRDFLEDKW